MYDNVQTLHCLLRLVGFSRLIRAELHVLNYILTLWLMFYMTAIYKPLPNLSRMRGVILCYDILFFEICCVVINLLVMNTYVFLYYNTQAQHTHTHIHTHSTGYRQWKLPKALWTERLFLLPYNSVLNVKTAEYSMSVKIPLIYTTVFHYHCKKLYVYK